MSRFFVGQAPPCPSLVTSPESHSRSRRSHLTPLAAFQREDERNKIVNSVLWVVRINQASRGGRTSGSRCIGSFRGHFIVKKDCFFTKGMLILRIALKIVLLDYSLFVFHNSYMTWRHVPTLLAHRTVALVLSLLLNNTSHHIIHINWTFDISYYHSRDKPSWTF